MRDNVYNEKYFNQKGDYGWLEVNSNRMGCHLMKLTTEFERDFALAFVVVREVYGYADSRVIENALEEPIDYTLAEELYNWANDPSVELEEIENSTLQDLLDADWAIDEFFDGYDIGWLEKFLDVSLSEVEQLHAQGYEFYSYHPRGFDNEKVIYTVHKDDVENKERLFSVEHSKSLSGWIEELTPAEYAAFSRELILFNNQEVKPVKSSIVVEAEQMLGKSWKQGELEDNVQQERRGIKL